MKTKIAQRRRFVGDTLGAAAIEFAIVAPVFLFLMMGMIAYGLYFGAMHSIQQIAADAARTAIAGLTEQERKKLVHDFIEDHADGYAFVSLDKLAYDVRDSTSGEQVIVSLRYDAEDLPIWNLLKGLPLPGQVIHRTSTIRIGGI